MAYSLKILTILYLLLVAGCMGVVAEPETTQTDKIHLYFGEEKNTKSIVAEDYELFSIYIHMDINNISNVEITDVSSSDLRCTDDILKSPAKIASYKFNPELNVKDITFRMRLPCASYHEKFYMKVKVTSLSGNYYIQQKIPVRITREGPGYFIDGQEYSGTLPRKKN